MCPSPRRHSLPVRTPPGPGEDVRFPRSPDPPLPDTVQTESQAEGPLTGPSTRMCRGSVSFVPFTPATVHCGLTHGGGQCRRGDRASVRVDVQGSGRPGSAESPRATFWGTNSAGPWGRPAFVRPDAPSHSRKWEAQRLLQTHVGTASLMTNATCGDLCGVQQQVASQGSHWSALSAPAYHGAGELAATWSDGATRQPSTGQTQVSAWGGWPGRTRQRGELGCGVGRGRPRRCPVIVGTRCACETQRVDGEAPPPAGHGWKGPWVVCPSLVPRPFPP